MNKKRKILTLLALVAFSVIIAMHSYTWTERFYDIQRGEQLSYHHPIEDVRMPLFVLAVFYAGLFAALGDNKRKEQ